MSDRHGQLTLFMPDYPGVTPAFDQDLAKAIELSALDVQARFKAGLAKALKASPLSREQIADRVNAMFGSAGSSYKVSPAALDRWAAPSDTSHNCPGFVIPALCLVLESFEPLQTLLIPLGLSIAGERERALMILGESQILAKKLTRKRRRALEALAEMGL